MVLIKSKDEIEKIRQAGKILKRVFERINPFVKEGITTEEIDQHTFQFICSENAQAAFKGYKGYPASICISINEEIVHGIPSKRKLVPGDIVSLDIGINFNGYFADAALTLGIGEVSPAMKRLIEVTHDSLREAIRYALPYGHLGDISSAVQKFVEAHGFSVVRQFCGHGTGRFLHEQPEIPNFGVVGEGIKLYPGMVLAIEPMVNEGGEELEILDNGWTAVTKDRRPSAHFEHTVAITENGPEVLA